MQSMVRSESKIILLGETDSTNNYATRLLKKETVAEGTVILTKRQTSGKGYGRNSWDSEENKNLTFSIILYPGFLHASRQFLLSQAVSLGITGYLSEKTGAVSVKWPNDILIGNRKVAGILIENVISGSTLHSSVIGVGLNVNQRDFPAYLQRATSLCLVTGKTYDLDEALQEIVAGISLWYNELKSGRQEKVRNCYLAEMFRKDELTDFRTHDRLFSARIRGIDEFGQLMLEELSGKISVWPFKSVEMVY